MFFVGREKEDSIHVLQKKNKAYIFVCTFNLHIFLAQFTKIVFLTVLPSRNGKIRILIVPPICLLIIIPIPDYTVLICCVFRQTDAEISRLFGLRMRGDDRHWRVGVVLEVGRTDGWTDGLLHGLMDRWRRWEWQEWRKGVEKGNRGTECGAKPNNKD